MCKRCVVPGHSLCVSEGCALSFDPKKEQGCFHKGFAPEIFGGIYRTV